MAVFGLALAGGLVACGKERTEERRPPPPVASSVCAAPGSPAEVAGVSLSSGEFCVDSGVDVRSYDAASQRGLDGVCVELFNGECELYKRFGLWKVVTLRLSRVASGPGWVSVVRSEFETESGAHGFYTRRILGDSRPESLALRPLKVQGRAALGQGVAYLWRGRTVHELSFLSEESTPEELVALSDRLLPPLVSELAQKTPGSSEPSPWVLAAESQARSPFALRVHKEGPEGLRALGESLEGFGGNARLPFRFMVARRDDEAAARGVLTALAREAGARPPGKEQPEVKFRRLREGVPPEEWLFSQRKSCVAGATLDPEEGSALDAAGAPSNGQREAEESRKELLRELLTRCAG